MIKRITLIAPQGNPERRVRIFKSVTVVKSIIGCDVDFWGWKREKDDGCGLNWDLISSQRAILKGGGYSSKKSKLLYIAWAVSVFFNVLLHGPKRIYCLGLETAAPVWAATRIRRKSNYIFDDADRLVMVWNMPKPIDRIFRWLERKVSQASSAHIIPVRELYDFTTDKMQLVYNMPIQAQIDRANAIKLPPKKDGLVVYVNGVLNETRNIAAITKAAVELSQNPNSKTYFKLATPQNIDGADHMANLSNVENLGWLPQDEALAHYRNSDVVLTVADITAVASYKFAWPNKWGDAVSMGTPIIVNADMVTAAPFLNKGMAMSCPYGDARALIELLQELERNPMRLTKAKKAIASAKTAYPSFDEAIAPALYRLFDYEKS